MDGVRAVDDPHIRFGSRKGYDGGGRLGVMRSRASNQKQGCGESGWQTDAHFEHDGGRKGKSKVWEEGFHAEAQRKRLARGKGRPAIFANVYGHRGRDRQGGKD